MVEPFASEQANRRPSRNVPKPALAFERFFRRMHALVADGKLTLPPKNFGSLIRISMLFVEHENEIKSAKPPHVVMRALAFIGRLLDTSYRHERRQKFQMAYLCAAANPAIALQLPSTHPAGRLAELGLSDYSCALNR